MATKTISSEGVSVEVGKTQTRSRAVLGDVTFAVCNAERKQVTQATIVKKKSDKILVSALKHTNYNNNSENNDNNSKNNENAPTPITAAAIVKKQVKFRAGAAVARASVPTFCVCDPLHSSPLVACEQCSEWHVPICCGMSGDNNQEQNMSSTKIKLVCLPCRQQQILNKLYEKLQQALPPSQAQAQTVCVKLRIPLPLNPTHDDALVHLCVFLLKAPELRVAVCSKELAMKEVVVQLETCGVKRGKQGQIELLSDLSFATLRQACRACGLDANGSKSDMVVKFHSFITGTEAPALPLEPAPPRKRAKTKLLQSPGAPPKSNPRVAAKRSKMLQAFKITELKKECKSRDLSTAGSREEIVARLVEYLGSQSTGKHKKDCLCDVCDLDNAMFLASVEVPSE